MQFNQFLDPSDQSELILISVLGDFNISLHEDQGLTPKERFEAKLKAEKARKRRQNKCEQSQSRRQGKRPPRKTATSAGRTPLAPAPARGTSNATDSNHLDHYALVEAGQPQTVPPAEQMPAVTHTVPFPLEPHQLAEEPPLSASFGNEVFRQTLTQQSQAHSRHVGNNEPRDLVSPIETEVSVCQAIIGLSQNARGAPLVGVAANEDRYNWTEISPRVAQELKLWDVYVFPLVPGSYPASFRYTGCAIIRVHLSGGGYVVHYVLILREPRGDCDLSVGRELRDQIRGTAMEITAPDVMASPSTLAALEANHLNQNFSQNTARVGDTPLHYHSDSTMSNLSHGYAQVPVIPVTLQWKQTSPIMEEALAQVQDTFTGTGISDSSSTLFGTNSFLCPTNSSERTYQDFHAPAQYAFSDPDMTEFSSTSLEPTNYLASAGSFETFNQLATGNMGTTGEPEPGPPGPMWPPAQVQDDSNDTEMSDYPSTPFQPVNRFWSPNSFGGMYRPVPDNNNTTSGRPWRTNDSHPFQRQ